MHYSLLLVENKTPVANFPFQYLADNGHAVILTHSCEGVTEKLAAQWPDLVILNLIGEHLDALALNRAIDDTNLNIPQLAVVENPPPAGLQVEALVQTPYTGKQLLAHISQTVNPNRFLRWDGIVFDTHTKTLLRAGQTHHFTPKLFELFMRLVENQGSIVYRKTIMKDVWETDYMGDTRTLDVHMRWLREKIEDNPSRPKYILTIRGAGYRFVGNITE